MNGFFQYISLIQSYCIFLIINIVTIEKKIKLKDRRLSGSNFGIGTSMKIFLFFFYRVIHQWITMHEIKACFTALGWLRSMLDLGGYIRGLERYMLNLGMCTKWWPYDRFYHRFKSLKIVITYSMTHLLSTFLQDQCKGEEN